MPDRIKQKMMARLMEAARSGSAREVWALLLAGVAKDARDGRGNTALHLAADGGHAITVKHLLDAGLDANSVNSNRRTPLHLAAQRGNTDVIWMLVRASARVDAQDATGQTALHVAASVNTAVKDDRVHVVNTLLLAGATKDITDLKKQKPEHLATVSTKTAFSTFNTVSSPYIDL
ncbi:CARD- and ANK-domain containing inflammasome adapter protein-like isoform X2 [Schistocerca serialis cubense]|nr:CARD- and ANK-domain containing inflammasome adapter protein-like isoform X2 [Schistocerca serialis cubense]